MPATREVENVRSETMAVANSRFAVVIGRNLVKENFLNVLCCHRVSREATSLLADYYFSSQQGVSHWEIRYSFFRVRKLLHAARFSIF